MNLKRIRQSVTFTAKPKEIYEMLMDSRKHARFTEAKASISRKVGGRFTASDGYIQGANLELVPGKKIVQKWRGKDWPEGHYSKVTFFLKKVERGTRLAFTQTGVPAQFHKDINQGWHDAYWSPMKKMIEERTKTNA